MTEFNLEDDLASLLNLSFNNIHEEMREYAKENNVPIIEDSGLAFLETIIKIKQPKNILEIGTAIGYSSTRFSLVNNSDVYTIEKNKDMYEKASFYIDKLGMKNKVHQVLGDALLTFDEVSDKCYDIIFIDAAKAQYKNFFELYSPLLNKGGIIITDNMFFHGLVFSSNDDKSRNLRALVRKLKTYHDFLFENEKYTTKVFNIGDGIAITYLNE